MSTLLIDAVYEGDILAVKILLDTYPNIIRTKGETALIIASARGLIDIVRLLLTHGVNVDATNEDGDTPLMIASWQGNLDLVKLLLDKGADPNVVNKVGMTALSIALKWGHKDVAILLVLRGAKE